MNDLNKKRFFLGTFLTCISLLNGTAWGEEPKNEGQILIKNVNCSEHKFRIYVRYGGSGSNAQECSNQWVPVAPGTTFNATINRRFHINKVESLPCEYTVDPYLGWTAPELSVLVDGEIECRTTPSAGVGRVTPCQCIMTKQGNPWGT